MKIIENRKKYFAFSLLMILIGFGAMFLHFHNGNGLFHWDVEFTGGTSMEIDLGEAYDTTRLEKMIYEITGQTSPQIQQILGTDIAEIKLKSIDGEKRIELLQKVKEEYPSAECKEVNDVSGTVSKQMQQAAIKATIIACIAMLIYISIRFKDIRAGGSAILALLHDVLMVLASYALFRIPVNHAFIAVLLTVLGYSVNSTIVIFDRIRENGKKFQDTEIGELMNQSIGQTLSRTIHTSLTTLFTIGAIYIFGVPSIKEFALPMMIGIISGAYSSIFISASIWYEMLQKKMKKDNAA